MADSLAVLNTVAIQNLYNPPVFQAYQASTVTSMANAFTWTSVAFADLAGIVVDNYAGHSTSVNPSRYVIKVAGTYIVSGVVCFATNATGFRASRFAKNGVSILGSGSTTMTIGTGLATSVATPTFEIVCAVGDYLELQGTQQSGGALNTSIGTDLNCQVYIRFSHQ